MGSHAKSTTFRIYLPITTMEAEVRPESVQPIPFGKGETILISEDEPQVREVLRLSLEEYGYVAIEAQNGEDAVKLYKDNLLRKIREVLYR
jgi:two-component system cell cycle sensor histidine kinase/response regulator CckA